MDNAKAGLRNFKWWQFKHVGRKGNLVADAFSSHAGTKCRQNDYVGVDEGNPGIH